MYYSDELIEQIRQSNEITEVISSYVRIQKKGSTYMGLCPFHNEKSPSFSVSSSKQIFHCFGCGAGGNVFTFLMKYENYSFVESVVMLAERVGIALPKMEHSEESKRRDNRRSILLEINKEAARFYYYQLRAPQGQIALSYLQDRQLHMDTMKGFGIGYAGKYSNALTNYLKEKGYTDQMVKDAGLISIEEQRGTYDKFWNRVMFPIQDINHRVIGFGGRVLGDGKPKYLNSPETDIFDKGRNLYGLNFARTSRKEAFILCEGYMDVIAMHQAGFTEAVASLGTAFTSGHASLLRRYAKEVLLLYDSDDAGVNATLRALPILKEAGISGKVVSLEPYKDPDDFIKEEGSEAFAKRLAEAVNGFFFEISILEKKFDLKDPAGKTNFHTEIAKKLCAFSQEVERENYLEAIAERYHIGFENLRKLVASFALQTGMAATYERPKSGIQKKNVKEEGVKNAQRLLLTWLSEDQKIYDRVSRFISKDDFITPLYQKVAETLFAGLEQNELNPASIISLFEEEEEQREVASLFNTKINALETIAEKERALHDIMIHVKRNSYEHYSNLLGSEVTALNQVIEGKKKLEELSKTHISLD